MKLNQNVILLILAVVLGGIWWLSTGPLASWTEQRKQPSNPFAKIITSEIKSIEVVQGKKTTKLFNDGEIWYVGEGKNKFPVMKSLSDMVLEKIASSSNSSLQVVSVNKERQAEFQVSGDSVVTLKIDAGKKKVEVNIGKMTTDYQSSYLALNNDANTYKFDGVNLRAVFERDEWRDLAIFQAGEKSANYLRLQYPGRQVVLEKKGSDWMSGKTKYKATEVEKITTRLNMLTASKIPEQDFKPAGLDKPEIILQVKGEGLDNTLMVGKATKDNMYYVKTGSSDNLYLISKVDHDTLVVSEEKLK